MVGAYNDFHIDHLTVVVFFGLGWLRITTYILVKKLLFALTILRLEPDNVVRKIFTIKVSMFNDNRDECSKNCNHSPAYDILNNAIKAGVYNILYDMTMGKKQLIPKVTWSKLIWSKAWQIDDIYWHTTSVLNKNNDLLMKICSTSRYLPWWELSDISPDMIGICETMSRLICHASRLKSDDLRLKGCSPCTRVCSNCDMFVIEDLFHVIMQCPHNEEKMRVAQHSIIAIDVMIKVAFKESPDQVFNWLIGKDIPCVDRGMMYKVWAISGECISGIYKQICRVRSGIG